MKDFTMYLVDSGSDPDAYKSTDLVKAMSWVEKRCNGKEAVIWKREVSASEVKGVSKTQNRYTVEKVWKNRYWLLFSAEELR